MNQRRQGFTILELSVVIAFTGIIAGAVISGQQLIHNAELNSVVTEAKGYSIAMQQFKDKYAAMPGDMTNATTLWTRVAHLPIGGGQGSTDANYYDSEPTGECANPDRVGTGKQTCNGNGDGRMGGTEAYRAWQHLANAGMIAGQYKGAPARPVADKENRNFPVAKIPQSGWGLGYADSTQFADAGGANYWGPQSVGNTMFFGGIQDQTDVTRGSILKPVDANSIDGKIDDGTPGNGNILAEGGPSAACATDAKTYAVGNTRKICALRFMSRFLTKNPY